MRRHARTLRRPLAVAAVLAAALSPATAQALSPTPNDPYYSVQWSLHGSPASTNANQAWCNSTGAGILIADIDSGVDFGHPDLQSSALVAGAAFTSGNSSPGSPQPDATGQNAVMDDYGHGTMTTGIMVARTGNGTGIAGEAPGARALVMKVFSNGTTGYGAYTSDVDSAIVWAVQHGARVINLSLGPNVPVVSGALGDQTPQWVQWASQNGAAVAIAAGNNSIPAADYLNMMNYALVVGALGPSGSLASYSQSGTGVNIYGPGGDGPGGDPSSDVISTFPTYALPSANQPLSENVAHGYAAYDGTSFATPYTAGVLALLMAHGYSANDARRHIIDTARNLGGGRKAVDAAAALGACSQAATTTTSHSNSTTRTGGGTTVVSTASNAQAAKAAPSATAAAGAPPPADRAGASGDSGGSAGASPGAASPPSGGTNPLLLVALGLLVVVGGPVLVSLRRRRTG